MEQTESPNNGNGMNELFAKLEADLPNRGIKVYHLRDFDLFLKEKQQDLIDHIGDAIEDVAIEKKRNWLNRENKIKIPALLARYPEPLKKIDLLKDKIMDGPLMRVNIRKFAAWVDKQLTELENEDLSPSWQSLVETNNRIKLKQIALIHAYEGKQITRVNAVEIAHNYGYSSPTSGEKLYQDYLKYVKHSERKARPTAGTKKTLMNKIELFESILPYLSYNSKQKAEDEINMLKILFDTDY